MRSRAIVDLDALRSNYAYLRSLVQGRAAVLCVVKADGYGHGAAAVGRALQAAGATHFGVACLEEAVALRDAGIGRAVLAFDGVEPGYEQEAAQRGIEPVVGSVGQLRRWNEAARGLRRRLTCHLLLNTGMNRLGVDFEPWRGRGATFLDALRSCDWLNPHGVATHLASAEESASGQTACQLRLFERQVAVLRGAGFEPRHIHAANSAAMIHCGVGCAGGEDSTTMVRPGLALYGYVAGPADFRTRPEPPPLRPALEWRARLLEVRKVPSGAELGYGATFRAPGPMRIGVLAVGYGDGLSWRLSNRGAAAVRGVRCPIVGRVSMDLTMVDLSAAPEAQVGDDAILLGSEPYSAQGMADLSDSIPYEVLCGISCRVTRQYSDEATGR